MKSRLIATGLAIVGYAIIDATPANAAETYTWDEGCGSTTWTCENNWDRDSGYPGSAANDVAIVVYDADNMPALNVHLDGTGGRYPLAGLNIRLDAVVKTGAFRMYIDGDGDPAATRLDIDPKGGGSSYGILQVESGGEVHLTGGGEHYNDGKIRLEASSSKLVIKTNSATLSSDSDPLGFVEGQHNDAEIRIDNVTLTSSGVDFQGRMKFVNGDNAGNFTNTGRVMANDANGTLDFQLTGTITDTGSDTGDDNQRWQVTASGAILRFLEDTATMSGRFLVSDGTLRAGDDASDNVAVVTAGDLSHTGGMIKAGTDDYFIFNN